MCGVCTSRGVAIYMCGVCTSRGVAMAVAVGRVAPIVKSQIMHRKFENNAPPPLKKIGFRFWNAAVISIYNPPPKYI